MRGITRRFELHACFSAACCSAAGNYRIASAADAADAVGAGTAVGDAAGFLPLLPLAAPSPPPGALAAAVGVTFGADASCAGGRSGFAERSDPQPPVVDLVLYR